MLGGTTYHNTKDSSGADCVLGKGKGSGGKRVGASWTSGPIAFGMNYRLGKTLQWKKKKVEEFNCQLGEVGDAMALLDHQHQEMKLLKVKVKDLEVNNSCQ
jgi:hypothetical protein